MLNGAWVLTVQTAHYERIMLSPSNFFRPHICINMSVWDQPGSVEIRFAAQPKYLSFFFFFFIPLSGGAASRDSSSRNPKMGSTEQILCHCTFFNVDFSGIRTVFFFLCDPKYSGFGVIIQYVFKTKKRN